MRQGTLLGEAVEDSRSEASGLGAAAACVHLVLHVDHEQQQQSVCIWFCMVIMSSSSSSSLCASGPAC